MFYKYSNTLCDFPNGMTKFCFLFGTNICHSPSPALHTGWFQKHALNYFYLPCSLKRSSDFLNLLERLFAVEGFIGGNITMPFKNDLARLARVEPLSEVQITRSANTLFQSGEDKWFMANTDIFGIEKTVEHLVPQRNEFEILVLGGGGAAASAFFVGENNPYCTKITCLTQDPVKTQEKFVSKDRNPKLELLELGSSNRARVIRHYQADQNKMVLVVNTLPLGHIQGGENNLNALELLEKIDNRERIFYFDMVYSPTHPILFAEKHGIKHANGQLMLEMQARKSFYHWTGIYP